MGNKLKRQQRAKIKAKKNRLDKHYSKERDSNPSSEDALKEDVIHVNEEMVSLFEALPGPEETYSFVPALTEGLKSFFDFDTIKDPEAFIASASVQYVNWYNTGSAAIYESEMIRGFERIFNHKGFQEQIAKMFTLPINQTEMKPRRDEFEKEIKLRLSKRLKSKSFEELSCGGSKMKFEMALAINAYPFELDRGEEEADYKPLLNDDEYMSGVFDDIIEKVFVEAQAI